jgi:hypothetical protein
MVHHTWEYMRGIFPHESKAMIKERVFDCTKVSIQTIERIQRQRADIAKINGRISRITSPKKGHRKCTVINLDDVDLYDVRNIIYNFHFTEGW